MRRIVEFSVKYPVTIIMVVLGIGLLGYISYSKLGIDLFPDLNNPRIFVEVTAGERPPEEMERQFVENIEALAIRQAGVVGVTSRSRVGLATVEVEYTWDKDMDEAFLDLQRALNGYAQNEEIEELTISRFNPNAQPVMTVAMTATQGDADLDELRQLAENYVRNELVRLEGVADVVITGQEKSRVTIETDPYRLAAFGLTAEEIATQIESYNRNVTGGSIEEMSRKYVIKGVSLFHSLEDIEQLVVAYRNEGQQEVSNQTAGAETAPIAGKIPVFLKDVASVRFENDEPVNITRLNGEKCLGLSIYKETRYNTVKAVEDLKTALAGIESSVPGYDFEIVENQGDFISEAIWEVEESALWGVLFAVAVLFVFLRRLGATLVISLSIPVSIIATFNLMYFNGLTLNIMTLGGLALGAGMLVDNAIVVLENIFRHRDTGLSYRESAILGASQVGGAITASTLTTIVVFLPIVYLQGASGELFRDQAWTVAFSLLSSLFVAILVIPMMVSTLFKSKDGEKTKPAEIELGTYGRMLGKILNVRGWIILFGVLLVSLGAFMVSRVGSEYMPGAESSEFTISLALPEGTRLERTNQAVANVEAMVRSLLPEGQAILFSTVGPSSSDESRRVLEGENTGTIKVVLSDSVKYTTSSILEVLGKTLGTLSDIEVTISRDETALQSILGTEGAPVQVQIYGEDFGIMEDIAGQISSLMKADSTFYNVRTSLEQGMPEIEVQIDRLRASYVNVGVETIATQIEDRLSGKDAGQLDHEGEMKDIVIQLPDVSRSQLEHITIRSGTTEFPLSDVATIVQSASPVEIQRANQSRIVQVTADITEELPFDKAIQRLEAGLSTLELPGEYRVRVEGEELKRRESMENLSFALILSIILVYMVLASQFESFVHPFTILLTIPLAGVGAIAMFYFGGFSLNIMGFIGLIMLAGIAVNDSIILVDAINQLKDQGHELKKAIMLAGQLRLRPIIMTSLTTILALLPLTFGFGESAALRQPMALAVIGGLVTSTLLTLVVIPCVYYVFDIMIIRFNRIFKIGA